MIWGNHLKLDLEMRSQQSFKMIIGHTVQDDPNKILAEFNKIV